MILNSVKVPVDVVDISSPGKEEEKEFMRTNSKKREGDVNPLPPQIFRGENYCGVSGQIFRAFHLKHHPVSGL